MNRIIAFILVLCALFSLVACEKKGEHPDTTIATSATQTPSTTPTEPIVPLIRRETTRELSLQYSPIEKALAQYGTPWNANVSLDIPVYTEYDLLFHPKNTYHLTRDSSGFYNGNTNPNIPHTVFVPFHPSALRLRTDGTFYAVYDTDTGYRLYIFFTPKKLSFHDIQFTGYPVVINKNKMLSLKDFEDIKIGDTMEKVEAVDDVVTLHKKQIFDIWNYVPANFTNLAKGELWVATVHYLKDGLLIYHYKMGEDKQALVTNILLYEDYVVPTADGELTSHKVKDIDLPAS